MQDAPSAAVDPNSLTASGSSRQNLGASEVFFLDYDSFIHADWGIATVDARLASLAPEVIAYIGDAEFVVSQHFATNHGWMPIVSKKKIYHQLIQHQQRHSSDLNILLYSMKLLMWWPTDLDNTIKPDARTSAYDTAKLLLYEAENAGIFTLQLLQAKILVGLYEIAHAIYPAAYLSIGACARYGLALGVDKINASVQCHLSTDPMDQEEIRRCWWAIVILDRFVNLGCPKRSLSTPEPRPQDLLPIRDDQWQNDMLPVDQIFTVSSPANVSMGLLARLAQAAYLLGYVFRLNAESDSASLPLTGERAQLDRTIWSLVNLSYTEGQVSRMAVCAQTAICYSSLITLHDPSSTRTDADYIDHALNILQPVAAESQWSAEIFQLGATEPLATISPLLSHWAYQAARLCDRLSAGSGEQPSTASRVMRSKLSFLGRRWLAARTYLHILEAKKGGSRPEATS